MSACKIVGLKVAIAMLSGYAVDLVLRSRGRIDENAKREAEEAFEGYEHHSNMFVCAIRRTLEIFIYVFVFSLILNIIIGSVGEERLAGAFSSIPVVGEMVAGLVGLIPNCAASVVITELYIDGIIGAGPLFAGLLVNAGVGTMVLIKTNRSVKVREIVEKFQMEITDACNHRCPHCYIISSDPTAVHTNRIVNDNEVIRIAEKLIEWGIFSVVITGGEPLIKKDLLESLVDLFTAKDIIVSLNSNLTLADDELMMFLKEKGVTVLTSCPSSISYNKLTGTSNYNLFVKNLKKAIDAGIHCSVNMVITRDNISDIISTAKQIKEMGCNSFGATPMSQNVDSPRFDLSLTIEEIHKVIADLLWVGENLDMRIDIFEALPKCALPKSILTQDYPFLYRKCHYSRYCYRDKR